MYTHMYIHTYTHTCMYVCIHAHIHTQRHRYVLTHTTVCLWGSLQQHMHTNSSACLQAYTSAVYKKYALHVHTREHVCRGVSHSKRRVKGLLCQRRKFWDLEIHIRIPVYKTQTKRRKHVSQTNLCWERPSRACKTGMIMMRTWHVLKNCCKLI